MTLDLLQVTLQYSNALFLAVMPQFSDYTKALDLPVSHPITPAEIRRFSVDQTAPMQCDLELTNGMVFWYAHGHVYLFDDKPHNYRNNQYSPTFPESFIGPLKMTKDEAVQLARKNVSALGYSVKQSLMDLEPEVILPPTDGTNTIPHYLFKWPSLSPWGTVEMEIDAERKTMVHLSLLSEVFDREPPKISVTPKWRHPRSEINPAYVQALMSFVLPQVSAFAEKLELPVKVPITTNDVLEYECKPGEFLTLRLTNDYFFNFGSYGYVEGFFTRKTYFIRGFGHTDLRFRRRGATVDDYVGEWRMNDEEMVAMARNAVHKLGRTPADFFADIPPYRVTKPVEMGKYVIPRSYIEWIKCPPRNNLAIAELKVEIDADKRCLRSFCWFNGTMPREWPKIEVAPYLKTNKPFMPQSLQEFRKSEKSSLVRPDVPPQP